MGITGRTPGTFPRVSQLSCSILNDGTLQLYLYFVMLSYSSYLQDKEGGKYGTLETIPMKAHADAGLSCSRLDYDFRG